MQVKLCQRSSCILSYLLHTTIFTITLTLTARYKIVVTGRYKNLSQLLRVKCVLQNVVTAKYNNFLYTAHHDSSVFNCCIWQIQQFAATIRCAQLKANCFVCHIEYFSPKLTSKCAFYKLLHRAVQIQQFSKYNEILNTYNQFLIFIP